MGNVVQLASRWSDATPGMLTRSVWAFLSVCGARRNLLSPCHPGLKAEQAAYRNAVAAFALAFTTEYPNCDNPRAEQPAHDPAVCKRVSSLLLDVYEANAAFRTKRAAVAAVDRRLARSRSGRASARVSG